MPTSALEVDEQLYVYQSLSTLRENGRTPPPYSKCLSGITQGTWENRNLTCHTKVRKNKTICEVKVTCQVTAIAKRRENHLDWLNSAVNDNNCVKEDMLYKLPITFLLTLKFNNKYKTAKVQRDGRLRTEREADMSIVLRTDRRERPWLLAEAENLRLSRKSIFHNVNRHSEDLIFLTSLTGNKPLIVWC